MHTVRTRRLLREICGPDTGSMTVTDRETVMPVSLVAGLTVVLLLAGCQQLASTANAAAAQPASVDPVVAGFHDSNWISQAHALAVKTGSDNPTSDLSN